MIQLILAFWLALAPAHHNTSSGHGNGTSTGALDTGGETEHIPPPPPPRP